MPAGRPRDELRLRFHLHITQRRLTSLFWAAVGHTAAVQHRSTGAHRTLERGVLQPVLETRTRAVRHEASYPSLLFKTDVELHQ